MTSSDPLPDLVRGLEAVDAAGAVDAGVGEEHVDPAESVGGLRDECPDARGRGDVAGDRGAADLLGHRAGVVGVEVVDHDAGALGGHPDGEGAADAAAGAGDDDPLVLELVHHTPPVRVTPPSRVIVWPVSHPASSDSRKATVPATSAGIPSRLSG